MFRRIAFTLTIVSVSLFSLAASNPVPLIYQPLSPTSVAPGHSAFTLTVRGSNFVSGAVIKANGIPLKTKFVNRRTLQAAISEKVVEKPGTASITVANPGSIDSNVIYFTVREPSTSVAVTTDSATIEGGYVAVGDFNNDHKPDIAVANINTVDTYLNAGKANFSKIAGPAYTQNVMFPPFIVADFNNDGNLDVAPCGGDGGPDPTTCDIYFGDGKGNLTLDNYQWVYAGVMADVNGDGILDNIAVWGDGYQSYLSISLGNGDGTFASATTVPTAVPGLPVIGDFNGDGKLDVATSVEGYEIPGPGTVAVFLGNGDGTVQPEVDYQTPWGGYYAAVADINGDGKLDIITGGFSVLMGKGDGTFAVGTSTLLRGSSNTAVQMVDVNGDGKLDLVTQGTHSQSVPSLAVLLGNGKGAFQTPILLPPSTSGLNTFGIADFNNDGLLDFAIGGGTQSTVLLQAPSN